MSFRPQWRNLTLFLQKMSDSSTPLRMTETPTEHTDPINAKILAISEDKIQGFVREPFAEIAERSGVDLATVIERIRAMLRAGTIRRVRQTLVATNIAEGAL